MPHKHAIILLTLIILGVVAGVVSGWVWGPAMESVAWLGTLFLNALKMLIIPLILAAVITGIASLGDIRRLGRIGGVTMGYYIGTTALAVFTGLVVVNLIQPGAGLTLGDGSDLPDSVIGKEPVGLSDIILSLISPNLVASAAEMQLLPLIVFAIVFGAALTTLGESGRQVISFFSGVNDAMMKLVIWLMYFAPIGIFALVAGRLGQAGGDAFLAEITAVGWYVFSVLGGLAIHFAVLLLILFLIAGRGIDYLIGMLRALFVAFGTASSTATLPLTLECVRENGVDERSARFVLPLGSTVNMDGTALYEAVAVLFIAQAYGIELGLMEQVIVFITATLAAVGAAGIPEAGLVMMVVVLSAVGLPLEGIALLLAVDWFLDRFRTTVNVWGDSVGAAVIDRLVTRRDG